MSDSIAEMVREAIAENRVRDYLRESAQTFLAWADDDLAIMPESLREKILERGNDAREAIRLLDEHAVMLENRIATGVQSFAVGTTVRIRETQIDWTGEDDLTVGLVGVVAALDVYPWPTPPRGKTAVRFKSGDVGYYEDPDGDFDANHVVYYLWTFSLEEIPEGTASKLPEPKTWNANPAPEGHRWAILYESNGNPNTELGGHNCGCYAQMVEYTEQLFGRVEAVDMSAEPEYMHRNAVRI